MQARGYTDAQVSGLDAGGPGFKLDAKALRGMERFLPALAGVRPSRERFWLRSRGLRGR